MKKVFLENETNNNKPEISDKYIQLEAKYVETSITSYRHISKYQYSKALDSYSKCHNLALQLEDNNKINDSLCNLAITYFYIGDTKTSLEKFLNLYNYYNDNEDEPECIQEAKIKRKVFSNLIIVFLSLGKINEAEECLNKLISFITNQEDQNEEINRLASLKEVLNIFFRLDTLTDVDKYKTNYICSVKESDKNNSNKYKEIIYKLMNTFYLFLHTNDIDKWIQCLQETIDYFKILKDYNGLIFSIYNLQTSIYTKSKISNDISMEETSKSKIKALIKTLVGNIEINDEEIEMILEGVKKKMEFSIKLYKQLLSLEQDLLKSKNKNKVNQLSNKENTQCNNAIIKLLLKFSIKYLNKSNIDESISSKLKNHISKIIEEIDNNNINIPQFQLDNISPDIIKGFENIFNNLKTIIVKLEGKNIIKQIKNYNKNQENVYNENKIVFFQGEQSQLLLNGQEFEKINYSSGGMKLYFYKLDYDKCGINRYKKNNKRSDQLVLFQDVLKIKFGIYSNNLIKKITNSEYTIKSWTYLSLITMKRSIDLHSVEDNVDCWFYGLNHYLCSKEMKTKICSCKMFLLNKIKAKMIYKLKEMTKNKNENFEQINKIYKDECFNVQKPSFVKCFLLFNENYGLK